MGVDHAAGKVQFISRRFEGAALGSLFTEEKGRQGSME